MRTTLPLAALALAGCTSDSGLRNSFSGTVAVTAGDFDDVAAPLNRMVVEHGVYEGIISSATWDPDWNHEQVALKVEGLLPDYREMTLHGAIFVASGTRGLGTRQYNGLEPDDHLVSDPDVVANVRDYVAAGNVLLVTDWGYDLVEAAWPDMVTFLNDDTVLDDAQRGEIDTVVADVVHEELAEELGSDTLTLRFDYSNWAVMTDAGPDTDVLLRGDATYRIPAESPEDETGWRDVEDIPLAVSYAPNGGSGRVVFLSFHLDAQSAAMVDRLLVALVGDFEDAAGSGSVDF